MNLVAATQPLRGRPAFGYVLALLSLCCSILVCIAFGGTAQRFPSVIFLPPVVLATFLGGIRPGLLAALRTGGLAPAGRDHGRRGLPGEPAPASILRLTLRR